MKLLVATRSPGKQREACDLLAGLPLEVLFPDDVGIPESRAEDGLEVGDSFRENARLKAEFFAKRSGLPTIADDSGLEVLSLGSEPGVRSRRWANATGTAAEVDAANNALLVRRLLGAAEFRRRARYRCVLAFIPGPGGMAVFQEGQCGGVIATEARGTAGFGYDPLFISDELGKTFGEATPEEKHAVSHRGRAFAALRPSLERFAAGETR